MIEYFQAGQLWVLGDECHFRAIKKVNQHVAKRDEVVAPARLLEFHLISRRKYYIAAEVLQIIVSFMRPISVSIFISEAEIDQM